MSTRSICGQFRVSPQDTEKEKEKEGERERGGEGEREEGGTETDRHHNHHTPAFLPIQRHRKQGASR